MIQENNWVIDTPKKLKLPIFCGNGERVITIYGARKVPHNNSDLVTDKATTFL